MSQNQEHQQSQEGIQNDDVNDDVNDEQLDGTFPDDAEAEAALAAGFNKVASRKEGAAKADPAGNDSTPENTAPEKSDAEREAEEKARQEAEQQARVEAEWSSLPPSVRKELEDLRGLRSQVNKIAGHIGGLTNATSRIEQAMKDAKKATEQSGSDAPTDQQIGRALKNPEAMEKFLKDFPDFKVLTDEIQAIRGGAAQGDSVDVEKLRQDVSEQVGTAVNSAIDIAEERALVRLKHPTWKATAKTPEFADWLKAQPEELRKKATSDSADDAIAVFDGYEAHKKSVAEQRQSDEARQRRLRRAMTPPSNGSGTSNVGISDEEALERGFKRARGK